MVLQRDMWTIKFQHWSTTTGRFINASIKPLHIILVSQICIYFPLPLMIYPTIIKEPAIPQICSQLPSLLPQKTLLVIWSSLSDSPDLLPSDYPNTLHVIKKGGPFQFMVQRWYYCSKHGQKDATKIQGSIAPHALKITRNFIIIINFPGLVQRKGFA